METKLGNDLRSLKSALETRINKRIRSKDASSNESARKTLNADDLDDQNVADDLSEQNVAGDQSDPNMISDLGDQNAADRLLVQTLALGDLRLGLPVLQRWHRLNVELGAVPVALVLPRVTVADVAEHKVQVLVVGHERCRLLLEQRERLVAVRAPGGLAFGWPVGRERTESERLVSASKLSRIRLWSTMVDNETEELQFRSNGYLSLRRSSSPADKRRSRPWWP